MLAVNHFKDSWRQLCYGEICCLPCWSFEGKTVSSVPALKSLSLQALLLMTRNIGLFCFFFLFFKPIEIQKHSSKQNTSEIQCYSLFFGGFFFWPSIYSIASYDMWLGILFQRYERELWAVPFVIYLMFRMRKLSSDK